MEYWLEMGLKIGGFGGLSVWILVTETKIWNLTETSLLETTDTMRSREGVIPVL